MLGVHYRTVINWCNRAVAGEEAPIRDVYMHITGYYWISLDEVMRLKRERCTPTE